MAAILALYVRRCLYRRSGRSVGEGHCFMVDLEVKEGGGKRGFRKDSIGIISAIFFHKWSN